VKRSRIKFDIVFSLGRLHRYGTRILAVIYDSTFKAPICQGKLTYIVRDLYWRVWDCQFEQPIISLYWKLKIEYRCNIGGVFYIEAKKNTTNFPTESQQSASINIEDQDELPLFTDADTQILELILQSGDYEWYVKWDGYEIARNSWEPTLSLVDNNGIINAALLAYKNQHKIMKK